MKQLMYVTTEGVAPEQPGVCVAVESYLGHHVLRVFRMFNMLTNRFGGLGKAARCDADGLEFPSREDALAFAVDRGYLTPYYPRKRHCN